MEFGLGCYSFVFRVIRFPCTMLYVLSITFLKVPLEGNSIRHFSSKNAITKIVQLIMNLQFKNKNQKEYEKVVRAVLTMVKSETGI